MMNTAHTSIIRTLGVSRITHVAFMVDDLDTEKLCGMALELLETRLMGIPMGQS